MQKELFVLLVLLLVSNDIAYGENGNKTKSENSPIKKSKTVKQKAVDRFKRSSNQAPFPLPTEDDAYNKFKLIDGKSDKAENEFPFWGSRGRRDSSSTENVPDLSHGSKYCQNCNGICYPYASDEQNAYPFWGNRGRRNSDSQSEENFIDTWDERSRRQDDEDNPFWGSRGRRDEDPPFWGSRGRREYSFNGKHLHMSPTKLSLYDDEDQPFWGNRGRRKMDKVKNRRQDDSEPFWGSRGKKRRNNHQVLDDEREPFWANRGRRKLGFDFKYDPDIDMNDDIESMSKMKRKEISSSFWANRGRESKLKNLFSGTSNRAQDKPVTNDLNKEVSKGFHIKPSEQNTVHDDRIYADEPYYILIERSSRSSVEDDPYIITRGKKYSNYHLPKGMRDRRGALEDIVKSVQNDPYFIARGKKDSFVKIGNTIVSVESLNRDKEAVCALVNTLLAKNDGNKFKRDNDTERDRRTILKKLAAQLQEDPYFVSRGKKDSTNETDQRMMDFVEQIIEMCY